jgi:hypothetical protein
MWKAIISALDIFASVLRWFFNPKRKDNDELDRIDQELLKAYKIRDKAIDEKNTDILTDVTAYIKRLFARRNEILQRQRESDL